MAEIPETIAVTGSLKICNGCRRPAIITNGKVAGPVIITINERGDSKFTPHDPSCNVWDFVQSSESQWSV